MNLFQIVVVSLSASLCAVTVAARVRGRIGRRGAALWGVLWVGMVVAVLNPNFLTRCAAFLGIGRGADLLLYSAVIVMFLGFLVVFARLQHLRRDITRLVRELALRDALAAPWGDKPARGGPLREIDT